MFIVLLELNLQYSNNERVRIGPYSFPDWQSHQLWEKAFTTSLRYLNRRLDLTDTDKVQAKPVIGELIEEDVLMDPADPKEVVRNLEILVKDRVVLLLPRV